jgi:Tol biopolymer transport system component
VAAVPLDAPFVFQTSRDNRDDMVIVDREGGELRVLARAGDSPDWSRVGRIAFRSRATPHGINVIYPDGSGRRLVGPGTHPSWSPDSRFIAVSHNNGIYVLEADGGSAPRLVASPPAGMLQALHPAWSPDGQLIAFSVCFHSVGLWDVGCEYAGVYAVRADGSNQPTMVTGGAAHGPAWSPDGRTLAFADNLQVLVMDYPGGSPRFVAAGSFPAWTPDGRLVYQSPDGTQGWRLMINDGGVSRRLVSDVPSTLAWYGDNDVSVRR